MYVNARETEHCQIITILWQDIDKITNGHLSRNDRTMVQRLKASNELKKIPSDIQILCSISQNEHNRPDQTQLQIILFCDNCRGDETLAMSNANSKGSTNFDWLTIMLLIYEFTKWKFYHIKWLWHLNFY